MIHKAVEISSYKNSRIVAAEQIYIYINIYRKMKKQEKDNYRKS